MPLLIVLKDDLLRQRTCCSRFFGWSICLIIVHEYYTGLSELCFRKVVNDRPLKYWLSVKTITFWGFGPIILVVSSGFGLAVRVCGGACINFIVAGVVFLDVQFFVGGVVGHLNLLHLLMFATSDLLAHFVSYWFRMLGNLELAFLEDDTDSARVPLLLLEVLLLFLFIDHFSHLPYTFIRSIATDSAFLLDGGPFFGRSCHPSQI